jgi:hypothetical protein
MIDAMFEKQLFNASRLEIICLGVPFSLAEIVLVSAYKT